MSPHPQTGVAPNCLEGMNGCLLQMRSVQYTVRKCENTCCGLQPSFGKGGMPPLEGTKGAFFGLEVVEAELLED